jgi:hypothetical protein
MKLSEQTLAVLKNFASINVNLKIAPGKTVKTVAPTKNIFATSKLKDEFPVEVAIYDLPAFIQALTFFKDPTLEFGEKKVVISNGDAAITYFYSDPSIVMAPPEKDINLDETLFEWDMSENDVNEILKVTAALSAPTISVTSKKGSVELRVHDRKNDTSNSYRKTLKACKKDFDVALRAENFKVLPGAYKCQVARKGAIGVLHWVNTAKDTDLEYYATVEADSTL